MDCFKQASTSKTERPAEKNKNAVEESSSTFDVPKSTIETAALQPKGASKNYAECNVPREARAQKEVISQIKIAQEKLFILTHQRDTGLAEVSLMEI